MTVKKFSNRTQPATPNRIRSIRTQVIVGMLALLLPLITLLLVYNFYTVNLLREKTALSNKNTLQIYSEIVESGLQRTSSQLLDAILYQNNYYMIYNSTDEVDRYIATYDLTDQLQKTFASGATAELYYIITGNVNNIIYNTSSKTNPVYEQKLVIRADLMEFLQDETLYEPNHWTICELGGQTYLVKTLGHDGVYVGAAVNLANLALPLAKGKLFDDYRIVFTTLSGQPLNETDFISEKDLSLTPSEDVYTLSGFPDRYMILTVPLNSAPVQMVAAVKDPTFLTTLNTIQLVLFFASIMTVFLLPFAVLLLRRTVIKPFAQMVSTMEQIRAGNLDARSDVPYNSTEFKQVNDTFNQMIGEIQHLKIEAYEEQLAKQKAELQYLQFQIRPHFFLNSLKSLYGMAQNSKISEIQQLILALSSHFRYMFKDNFTLVTLKDELNHIKNYIQIQQLYTSKKYLCEIDVEEQLMNLMIPPISIQTFVENAIKHAIQVDRTLEIRIRARLLASDDGDLASIMITDNGPGFSTDMLDSLNFEDPQVLARGHIGLANVMQRLSIIYQGQAHAVFANSSGGGAVCEFIIPIGKDEEKQHPLPPDKRGTRHECLDS